MSFVRPEVAAALMRWREVLASLAALGVGLWIAGRGGPVMLGLGAIVSVAALVLTLLAWRRQRFQVEIAAPGVVEIDEGRISYLGPIMGGAVDIEELVEIEVLDVAGGRRCWRIRQADGQTLLIPLSAAGADALYEHFATLPGAHATDLLSALRGDASVARRVWARPGSGLTVAPH